MADSTSLRRASHGAHCCGITHIFGFPYDPKDICPARLVQTSEQLKALWASAPMLANCVNDARPEETAEARFQAEVLGAKNARTSGILEVVLTTGQCHFWRTIVEAEGFKEVSHAYNTNSAHTIHVFHACTNQP